MSDSEFSTNNPGDSLTDSLLQQVAANRGGHDEEYLARLESAIDAEDGNVIPMAKAAPRPWRLLSWSVAAAVAILVCGGAWAFFVVTPSDRVAGQVAESIHVAFIQQEEAAALEIEVLRSVASQSPRGAVASNAFSAFSLEDQSIDEFENLELAAQTSSLPVELNARTTLTPYIGYSGAPEEWLDHVTGGVSLSVGVDDFESKLRPSLEAGSTRYGKLIDNDWLSPRAAPLSTFSIDVDTASWTNLRGMIRSGLALGQIPHDAVRIEEMINYFDWDYPQPDGDHPFSFSTETASCPWNADHQLLRIGVQGRDVEKSERPAANLVFLLDVSGSMDQPNKLALVKKSIMVLAEELRETDCVSIVVYAGAEGLALPATSGRDTMAIAKALAQLSAGGSTNGGAGIKLAYRMAQENFVEDGINRVILCTDGDFNVGITGNESLVGLVENRAEDGVFLSVLGFGSDNLNDSMLEEVTNKGNGNYYFIDSLKEARKVFLRDLMGTLVTIAKDVKIQIEFNPAKVDSYRLIGYANRKLEAEDFENDQVDAGEVGSGHSVTALYEIVPAGKGKKGTGKLRYQKTAQPAPEAELVENEELALLKLRYKNSDSDVSTPVVQPILPMDQSWEKASADFRFASAVSLFGLILRDHESSKGATLDEVIQLAESGKGNDPLGYRAEFIDLVKILLGAKSEGGASLNISF